MERATPDWDLILHHLEAASSYAEEGRLAELQRQIDTVRDEAARAAEAQASSGPSRQAAARDS
jgi:hypothetical protein